MVSLLTKWRLMLAIASDPALTGADKGVAAHLLDLTNATGVCWPPLDVLAARTRQTKRNILRCIERLAEAGYFVDTKSRGRGHAKTYRANFGKAEKVTGSSSFSGSEKVTAPSPIEPAEKVTGSSPIVSETEPEKVTAPSVKGDSPVREKVTAPSPHTYQDKPDQGIQERELALDHPIEGDPIEEAFAEWWDQYPSKRRVAKAKVLAKYRTILKEKTVTADELLGKVMAYAMSRDVIEGFACAPLRWLGEERWKLDYATEPTKPAKQSQHEALVSGMAAALRLREQGIV